MSKEKYSHFLSLFINPFTVYTNKGLYIPLVFSTCVIQWTYEGIDKGKEKREASLNLL